MFNVIKTRPLSKLMETAREMIEESLPIRCIDAVFLAIYFTQEMEFLDRFACSFRSLYPHDVASSRGAKEDRSKDREKREYRHIVLFLKDRRSGRFGSLGISRKKELMDKQLEFESLSDLIEDYLESYRKCNKTL